MPSKVDMDREADISEPRERRRYKSSRVKKKSSSKERDEQSLERSSTLADRSSKRRASAPVPELLRRASSTSPNGSMTSLPYPSFSKAHSREAVGSKDNLGTPPKSDLLTPDPTDLNLRSGQEKRLSNVSTPHGTTNAPPSPPLTAVDHVAPAEERRRTQEQDDADVRRYPTEARESKGKFSVLSKISSARASPLRTTRNAAEESELSFSRRSKLESPSKSKQMQASVDDESSIMSQGKSSISSPHSMVRTEVKAMTISSIESDSTSIASKQHEVQMPFSPETDNDSSPATATDSSPKTPTPRGTPFSVGRNRTPYGSMSHSDSGEDHSPMPPPPPPLAMPYQAPKVDYLMQNGGLPQPIPKNFLSAPNPPRPIQFVTGELPNPTALMAQVQKFFAPFSGLLDDYHKVMARNGSIAVATGYRSIARRLLDRLEAVFARDISSETCDCFLCERQYNDEQLESERGISWGEILEFVCGRRELPPWPPFTLDNFPGGLGVSDFTPMQKLDVDVPEEYRDHYIRQSKKTKQSVDLWLAGQLDDLNPPDEADDDTLTFAILTHLNSEQRATFSQLLGVVSSRPPSINPEGLRGATPLNGPKSELLQKTGLAVQRLYRLTSVPRAPECAIFLLNNPSLHNVLATLAVVSDGEWEILVSGRFDGFLRSGAEDGQIHSPLPMRGVTPILGRLSRGPTPLNSQSPNPASTGAPVTLDEETEIAALAEVEREIYMSMEAFEDAFEALHLKAEEARRVMRERAAGLSLSCQARKGGAANILEARLGTPSSAMGSGMRGWDSGTDDGIDDGMSEIVPDDSASNISSSKHRRPKRRNERRTPAPVEEADEEYDEEDRLHRTRALYSRNSTRRR